jgi:RNA polymerase sigma-70 factor (ECF subfamily)
MSDVALFSAARPRLLGLAYRMLGVYAEAEDVVQEAWLRWERADTEALDRPEAWLTTVTTRLALDRLRAGERRREEYVGPWLPEPVVVERGPEEAAELADSLTFGFLTLLDRLNPVERAVLLLADVFAVPFADIAVTVGKSDAACRQIASRARRRLQEPPARQRATIDRTVIDELLVAFATGDVARSLELLAPDVVCITDGGANRHAARRPVVGAARVSRFFVNIARRTYADATIRPAVINGDPGIVLSLDGVVDTAAAFEVEDGRVVTIWVIRNPEKLDHVGEPVVLT